jgi:hypothetical protein
MEVQRRELREHCPYEPSCFTGLNCYLENFSPCCRSDFLKPAGIYGDSHVYSLKVEPLVIASSQSF